LEGVVRSFLPGLPSEVDVVPLVGLSGHGYGSFQETRSEGPNALAKGKVPGFPSREVKTAILFLHGFVNDGGLGVRLANFEIPVSRNGNQYGLVSVLDMDRDPLFESLNVRSEFSKTHDRTDE
jgi:hypothetical protein